MANDQGQIRVAYLSLSRFEDPNAGSGIPRYARELYSNMELLKKPNIKLEKIVMKSYGEFGDAASAEINTIMGRLSRYDVVHSPSFFLMARNLKKDIKYVVSVHDLNPMMHNTMKGKAWYYLFFRRAIRYTNKRADHIIASSTQTVGELIKAGFDKRKITMVSLGIDKKFTETKRHVSRNRDKSFKIGYIGSLAPNKNVEMLVDASMRLPKSFITEIWGAKSLEYGTLSNRAQAYNNIKFMGFLPETNIIDTYDSFDVFVFPSKYEGFGLPVLEAQARGIPVIIYKDGKIPREVQKYCFKARDPDDMARIILQIKENGYDSKMRKNAMGYAKGFTWERTARDTLKVYEKVCTI